MDNMNFRISFKSCNRVIDLSRLSFTAFNTLLEFIYTGQISNLTQEISNELLEEMAVLFFNYQRVN